MWWMATGAGCVVWLGVYAFSYRAWCHATRWARCVGWGGAALVLVGIIPAWYAHTAAAHVWRSARATQAMALSAEDLQRYRQHPDVLVARLHSILKKNPNSAQGWFLLGRLSLAMGDRETGVNALARAWQLAPKQNVYLAAYASAIVQTTVLPESVRSALLVQLQQDPDAVGLNGVLGQDAFWRRDFAKAIHYWEHALSHVPPDTPESEWLLQQIAKAHRELGNPP
ncbi:MAG: hypothetical protein A3J38_05945 [Gammaproteobacteria bacterium RIFCSPHIGHO2_12_FULL_45_9]|nr:MAG: hypothetical protein A3J38_05945 [Gammaproteobacteria bacterium RIFCSPHIGHO2_12_FULL_45_9]